MLKSQKNFITISLIVLSVMFILGIQQFSEHTSGTNCGSYSSYIGKGSPDLSTPEKIEALTCFNESFSKCNSATLQSTASDWEGGEHKNKYTIDKKLNGSCSIIHNYEIEAFYVGGKSTTNRECFDLSIENYNLQLFNCKK